MTKKISDRSYKICTAIWTITFAALTTDLLQQSGHSIGNAIGTTAIILVATAIVLCILHAISSADTDYHPWMTNAMILGALAACPVLVEICKTLNHTSLHQTAFSIIGVALAMALMVMIAKMPSWVETCSEKLGLNEASTTSSATIV